MTTLDVNLVILLLGGLWLILMVASSARAFRAKRHGLALLFGVPVALVVAMMLLRVA